MNKSKQEIFGNFHPEKIKMVQTMSIGRSSVKFFTGLLDGHPSTVVLPIYFYPNRTNYNDNHLEIAKEYYQEVSWRTQNILGYFDSKKFPFAKFEKFFLSYLSEFGSSRKNCIIATAYAFSQIERKNNKKIKYLVCNPHSSPGAINCYKDFPNQKLFVTVRDFKASFNSDKIRKNKLYYLINVKEMFGIYLKISKKIGKDNVCVIHHEILHTAYPKTLNKICDFLKIEKKDCLEYSSFFGIQNKGDKSVAKSTQQINSAYPDRKHVHEIWKEGLSSFEIDMLQKSYRKIINYFGYKIIDPFKDPRFFFRDTLFRLLTRNNIEASKGTKKFLLISCIKIAKLPLIGPIFIFLLQSLFYNLKNIKSKLYLKTLKI